MAINSCSINGFTLHGRRCSDKFAALVPILHPPIVASTGTNPRVLRDTFQLPRQFEIEDQPHLTFEQPIITVTAEIFGVSGSDTQDVSAAQLDFVTVTDLELEPTLSIDVNITDLKFE